ncbi:MAG TPA: phosphate regulon transcriptional regulator PhoB [Syntrophales bacterium]|nr:phosphate regulon transcriptional regulator PhoB [Syntrophales bacterium]HPX12005.1 phosphate regulon transcriptional regulator PhoB [Syntrophales bacterium]HQN77554.1 phosphate regulon transcriptional regulator PhoB [Syntrophales bacterium]HQQ26510.1 phosphate regulon transcriptional regulator PhoB [Syntrophales bacterium]
MEDQGRNSSLRILIVDDEKDLVDLLSYNLEKEGYAVLRAYDGEEALKILRSRKPDLILLDLMLPGIQGMEICKIVRKTPETAALPIIMLTARGEEVDRIVGLEMGADDYVTKPFSVRELLARVRAVLRRYEAAPAEDRKTIRYGDLFIDHDAHEVTLAGRKVALSPTEFRLLWFLARTPGRVFTREILLDRVWGDDTFVEPRTVDVHIRRLRAQIEPDLSTPRFVLTVRGVGYKFAEGTE